MLSSPRDKRKARTVVGRREEGPLRDPGSELLLTGMEGENHKRDDKKKNI